MSENKDPISMDLPCPPIPSEINLSILFSRLWNVLVKNPFGCILIWHIALD